jgi:hypothetical protein
MSQDMTRKQYCSPFVSRNVKYVCLTQGFEKSIASTGFEKSFFFSKKNCLTQDFESRIPQESDDGAAP